MDAFNTAGAEEQAAAAERDNQDKQEGGARAAMKAKTQHMEDQLDDALPPSLRTAKQIAKTFVM